MADAIAILFAATESALHNCLLKSVGGAPPIQGATRERQRKHAWARRDDKGQAIKNDLRIGHVCTTLEELSPTLADQAESSFPRGGIGNDGTQGPALQ